MGGGVACRDRAMKFRGHPFGPAGWRFAGPGFDFAVDVTGVYERAGGGSNCLTKASVATTRHRWTKHSGGSLHR